MYNTYLYVCTCMYIPVILSTTNLFTYMKDSQIRFTAGCLALSNVVHGHLKVSVDMPSQFLEVLTVRPCHTSPVHDTGTGRMDGHFTLEQNADTVTSLYSPTLAASIQ